MGAFGRGVDTTDAATAHAAILEAITDGDEFRAQETAIAHGAHETELLIEARLELMMNRALDGR